MMRLQLHNQGWNAPFASIPGRIGVMLGLTAAALLTVNRGDWKAQAADLPIPRTGHTGFTLISPASSGVEFTNSLADDAAARNQILLSGSGVACGDVNGDGRCDLYFCRLEGPNALYVNLGDWRFTNVAAQAGVECADQFSTGAALADVDGDGDLDLLVNGVGTGTRLFLNDGRAHFKEDPGSGLVRQYGAMGMGLGDLDNDGDLDLYVGNYRSNTVRSTGFDLLVGEGRRMVLPQDRDRLFITPDGFVREYGEPDFCYLNDGKGHFTAVSWTDGRFTDEAGKPLVAPPRDWTYSTLVRDLNGDGAPDLYTTGDFWSPDRCWINDGHARFHAIAREALPCACSFSMGVDSADINRDGYDDLLVLDMLSPNHSRRLVQTVLFGLQAQPIGFSPQRPEVGRNTLFLGRADGTFAEIACLSGLAATDWSWSPVFLDVDLDGYEDVLIPTGHGFDTQDADAEQKIRAMGPWPREKVPLKLLQYPPLRLPNLAYRNQGDLTFKETGREWGFDLVGISQGIALADLDQDGDLDVVLNNMNSAAALLRNDSDAPRVAVRLRGQPPNTGGIGARIRVLGGPVPQSQQMIAGGRFCSSDEALRAFAAGTPTNLLTVEVQWRDGSSTTLRNVRPNQVCEVRQEPALSSSPRGEASTQPAGLTPLFVDVSPLINHRHHEDPFDDWARQPLLPWRLSQSGPGISWFDLDGDGRDDLVVGAGKGGVPAILRNREDGTFRPVSDGWLAQPVHRDLTTLLAGASNFEDDRADLPMVLQYDLATRSLDSSFAGAQVSAGPLALADYDGDGDLDLFVGGRSIPGRYPQAASSFLFRNDGKRFALDTENSRVLVQVGLVIGAVWTDLDGDGWPELVLACEWGPLKVFANSKGTFRESTDALGLDRFAGWWNGVTSGDFDGDGRMDLAASNWGCNTRYEVYRQQPILLYYGDFMGAGRVDLLEAYTDPEMGQVVPWRSLGSVLGTLPFVQERFTSHAAFAQATAAQILGDHLARADVLKAQWLESTVFLNRGSRFEPRVLPIEAQLAPAFGLSVGDFDGDGHEDLFLSQNFAAVHPEDSPLVSGRGLVLKGSGDGTFQALSAAQSGVAIYGEQRGCAVADFDADGRPDLAVGQNGFETKLFRNAQGRPGLRVRLPGGPANPFGIGATLRIRYSDQSRGPLREIHAGSGYWSQDSPVQVLGHGTRTPQAIEVRWPGGRTTEIEVRP